MWDVRTISREGMVSDIGYVLLFKAAFELGSV